MKLNEIQQKLKSPKNQHNSFGGYNYRSCEDILEAVKPLLGDSILTITDKIVLIGDRFYVEATATFSDGDNSISVSAYAREPELKKGMDAAQITGSASSYARKYALNGLFLIDDTKDPDTQDNTKNYSNEKNQEIKADTSKINFNIIVEDLKKMTDSADIDKYIHELKQNNLSEKQIAAIDKFGKQARERIRNEFEKQNPIDNILEG